MCVYEALILVLYVHSCHVMKIGHCYSTKSNFLELKLKFNSYKIHSYTHACMHAATVMAYQC